MSIVLALLCGLATGAEVHVVRNGETLEAIAAKLGAPGRAAEIAELNGLKPDEVPAPGTVLTLPKLEGHIDQEAVLLSFSGRLEVKMAGGKAGRPSVGLRLPLGSTVCTGEEGFATLRLAMASGGRDHDDLTLFPETCVTIDSTSARGSRRSTLLSMASGSISVRSADETAGSVAVITPSGVTAGDGGGFRVSIEDEAARTEALYAEAVVFGAGEEVPLDAGYGSRVHTGQAPSDPVKLLDPGAPAAPDDGAPLYRADFQWVPVDRALAYRVELSSHPEFTEMVRVEDVGKAEWSPDRLFLPYRVPGLWWRVSAMDRTGFVGLPSEARGLTIPAGLGP